MARRFTLLLLAAIWCAMCVPSSAWAEDEYYLLGDLGVRVDLPDDWQPKKGKWTDASFDAERKDRAFQLFVWANDVQMPLTESDLDAWSQVFIERAETFGGSDAVVQSKDLATVAGRPTARFELAFDFGKDLKGGLSGASFVVEGKVAHFAIVTAANRAVMGAQALEMLLGRAEVRKPPAKVASGGERVEAAGVAVSLPSGWRTPLPGEYQAVLSQAGKLGLEDISPCWTALKPQAAAAPDVMITCQWGTLLGVVDSYSFEGAEEPLRTKLFPGVETSPATSVTNADGRVGFLFQPALEGKTLRVGIMPYANGAARTWVLGEEGQGPAFDAAITHVLKDGAFEGAHPAGFGDYVSYYLSYRPTSPIVIGPIALLIALIGGGIFLATRGGGSNPYADDEA